MRITSFFALSTLALFACRSDSNNTTDGNNNGDGNGSNGGSVKIQDVQNDAMPPGTAVTLHGVVVTAIDNFGGKVGDIWLEEPEGGAFSGIHVFGAPTSAVAALAVGDVVDLSGAVKDEFALTSDTTGRTETELKPAMGGMITITKTGTGTVPAPQMVDALAIGMMADPARSMEWEKWEGVLVTLNNVTALGAPTPFGSTTPTPADNYSFGITGVAKVEGSLSDITMSNIARNTCMASVTGVMSYFFDYLVLPRQSSELATGGTACPAPEATASLCGDSIDNDGNGFTDCGDNSCIVPLQSCRMATTIASLDQAADANPAMPTLPTGGLEIASACVTAVPSGTAGNVYIADAGTAANDGGLYVFGGSGTTLPSGVAPGTLVDVIGKITTFKAKMSTATNPQLEFSPLQITKLSGTCVPVAKNVTSDMATMTQDASGHPLIGSYVTLTPSSLKTFKITTAQSGTGKFGVLTQNGTTISFGMTILSGNLGAANVCFASIKGIWTYDTNGAGSYEILPTEMPASVTCN